MATIWLTYSWVDNASGDVDFAAQELNAAGLTVKLDRWNLKAGSRLWEQIEHFIQNPGESDAWVLYATQNSLGSEACKEEYAYALDRALKTRGAAFPVIGLFPGPVDDALIPAGIKTRLYVSLTDVDWKERIKAAAEGRSPTIARVTVEQFFLRVDSSAVEKGEPHTIEVRPRAGRWHPFVVAVPVAEKDAVKLNVAHGPSGQLPRACMMQHLGEFAPSSGEWVGSVFGNQATPTESFYIYCAKLPSRLLFGPYYGDQFVVPLRRADAS